MMSKQDTIRKEIKETKAHLDELERRPTDEEFPDGTFGRFWDSRKAAFYGFLKNRASEEYKFALHQNVSLNGLGFKYRHFEPLTEAVLPIAIEHDGGEYPGNDDDIVMVYYSGSDISGGYAKNRSWAVVRSYQLIKSS